MTVSNAAISDALLISTRDGTYPESEEVLTTDLSAFALRPSLQLIGEAKQQIETDIRGLSQNSSSDVDEWIAQASHLQEDIRHSKNIAREIVKEYEDGQNLSAKIQDAKAKVELLQKEIFFNQAVTSSLEDIWSLDRDLNKAESILASGRPIELVAGIEQLSFRTERLADSNAKEINNSRVLRLREAVVESLTAAASSMVQLQKADGQQHLRVDHGTQESLGVTLDLLLEALEQLDSMEGLLRNLSRAFHRRIFQPVLSPATGFNTCFIDEESHALNLSSTEKKKDAQGVLDCLSSVLGFLNAHLPKRLNSALGERLSEDLVDTLIRDWLTPSVPLDLADILKSDSIQTTVADLANQILSYHWPGDTELMGWLEGLPHIWLEKRRNSALDAVRRTLKARRGPNKEARRTERQNVSALDEAFAQNGYSDDNANSIEQLPETTTTFLTNPTDLEEEDLSGWDFDDDGEKNDSAVPSPTKSNGDIEDASDAWEWDEDNAEEKRRDHSSSGLQGANLVHKGAPVEHREVTLTETYTITDIPDHLLDFVSGEVRDAEQMKTPEYIAFERISASTCLRSLPTLILAMFRATAPAHYSTIPSGNMHLYNDCVYLVDKLRDFAKSTSSTQLSVDCDVLEKFAKSAYAREMDLQRTVLSDILDGAQGFVNCTRFPYSAECETAVNSAIDRLRAVHRDWSSILSRSALLQSIGSLLAGIIEKIIGDVEDMEDISEAESQRLTAFCSQISALEDLFISEQAAQDERADTEPVPLTAVYVSNWLRFQYLANILESSLVDIKYLWTEGELSLEFTADELIELIEALFAESSHRRSAIAEIRRSRP
ncbi:hypothetical protein EPUS_06461 [Endocarpon pusillum Z07020]|uniref:ZW10 C-terminal helical domain-containing protein n=1 Tax=Endocarpon pusillum (strain Z07020 / HMAS-L-300199) TaxID=1263415 RepID=U1GYG2_ENDPU|nr:uncharacterized protein EPUS_06461 [Endocarpon pusillum Z07020]ERF77181.1 hypothetical protein EPUS_06461 [Endocarpon pusillum Z07020]